MSKLFLIPDPIPEPTVHGHPPHPRLLGPSAVHALRHVSADMPDLRRDQARTEQPSRTHRAHEGDRRRRAGSHAGVCRRDELLPWVSRLPDGMPGGRELCGALRNGAKRHRAVGYQRRTGAQRLARADARLSVQASARDARSRGADASLPAERTRVRGSHVRSDDVSARDAPPVGAANAADGGGIFESLDCAERITAR